MSRRTDDSALAPELALQARPREAADTRRRRSSNRLVPGRVELDLSGTRKPGRLPASPGYDASQERRCPPHTVPNRLDAPEA